MPKHPHLSWFMSSDKTWPYLYRRDVQRRDKPLDNHIPYNTFVEICEAYGLDVEDAIRSR